MPRKSYASKNRFRPRSRLSEWQYTRLLFDWLAGESTTTIALHSGSPSNAHELLMRDENSEVAPDFQITETKLKKISRQTVHSNISEASGRICDFYIGGLFDNFLTSYELGLSSTNPVVELHLETDRTLPILQKTMGPDRFRKYMCQLIKDHEADYKKFFEEYVYSVAYAITTDNPKIYSRKLNEAKLIRSLDNRTPHLVSYYMRKRVRLSKGLKEESKHVQTAYFLCLLFGLRLHQSVSVVRPKNLYQDLSPEEQVYWQIMSQKYGLRTAIKALGSHRQ